MPHGFAGFSPKALPFLKSLEKNNDRAWFQPRKEQFELLLRNPMLELVALLNEGLRRYAAVYVTEPKKAVMRIYRDTRFSKDKTPYKTNVAASFNHPRLVKNHAAAFYVGVSAAGVEVAGGMYMPGPDELSAVRRTIAADFAAFRRASTAPKLRRALGTLQGDSLRRPPRGFETLDADSPVAEAIQHRQFYFFTMLPPSKATGPRLLQEIESRFKAVAPFVCYLNDAVLARTQGEDSADPDRPVRPAPMFDDDDPA